MYLKTVFQGACYENAAICFSVLRVSGGNHGYLPFICPAAEPDRFPKDKKGVYDLTCKDISASFQKFMQCTAGKISRKICEADPDWGALHFDYNAVKELRNYHVIMLPGGEFDFFDELLGFCEGRDADDLEELFNKFPLMKADIELAMKEEVCPDYQEDFEDYYDAFMDGFITYEMFLGSHDISFTRLQFSQDDNPYFAGDRAEKVSLLADTIDRIEAGYGANEYQKELYPHRAQLRRHQHYRFSRRASERPCAGHPRVPDV